MLCYVIREKKEKNRKYENLLAKFKVPKKKKEEEKNFSLPSRLTRSFLHIFHFNSSFFLAWAMINKMLDSAWLNSCWKHIILSLHITRCVGCVCIGFFPFFLLNHYPFAIFPHIYRERGSRVLMKKKKKSLRNNKVIDCLLKWHRSPILNTHEREAPSNWWLWWWEKLKTQPHDRQISKLLYC